MRRAGNSFSACPSSLFLGATQFLLSTPNVFYPEVDGAIRLSTQMHGESTVSWLRYAFFSASNGVMPVSRKGILDFESRMVPLFELKFSAGLNSGREGFATDMVSMCALSLHYHASSREVQEVGGQFYQILDLYHAWLCETEKLVHGTCATIFERSDVSGAERKNNILALAHCCPRHDI
jgi:hypothetical protein